MNIDDIKDQLSDKISVIKSQIVESAAYNTLHEKYVTLPNSTQKIVNLAAMVLLAFSLFMVPLSFFMSSSDEVTKFEERRQLIRDLFKASRVQVSGANSGIKDTILTSKVQGIVSGLNLIEEQKGMVTPMSPEDMNSSPASKGVLSQGVQVTLKKLNLRQVLDASFRLQTLSSSIKLIGLQLDADTDDEHYFNTTFKLVSYFIETPKEAPIAEESSKKSKRSRRNKKRKKGK